MPKTTEEEKVTEVMPKVVESIQETNRILIESIVAIQEHNMKFVQSTFTNVVEAIKSQAETTRALAKGMEQQLQKERGSFQKLEPGLLDSYVNLLRAPLSSYQRVLDSVEKTTQQGREVVEKAITSFEKAEGELLRAASGGAPK